MTQPLAVSVVMSSYNRGSLLAHAIESVLAQTHPFPRFELIVVDNNSTDDTRSVVEGLIPRHLGALRYVFEGRQGLSHGRNAGIAHAQAPIVAFTDDDVRVAPDWVASIVTSLGDNPDVDYVGGKVLPDWPCAPPGWLTRDHWAPLALTDHGEATFVVDRSTPMCLVGASLAFRRRAFELVGNFDPAFQHQQGSVSSAEDHDIQLRLWRAGRKGLYDPAIVVVADVQRDRLTKAYHRRWHRDHSRLAPLLFQSGELIDSNGALVTRTGGRSLFGISGWAYRNAVVTAVKLMGAKLRGREGPALHLEGELREQLGWMKAQRVRQASVARPD